MEYNLNQGFASENGIMKSPLGFSSSESTGSFGNLIIDDGFLEAQEQSPLSPTLNSLFPSSQNDRFSIFHSPPQTSRDTDSNFYFPDMTYSQLDAVMKDEFDETVFDLVNPFEDERPEQASPVEPVQASTSSETAQNRTVVKQAKQCNVSAKQSRKAANKQKNEKLFPFRLHELASSENFQPLNWAKNGTWLSVDLSTINDHLKKICRTKKISSFLRQLHLYGFRKVSRSPPNKRNDTKVAFYRHSHFLEHSPELLETMFRNK